MAAPAMASSKFSQAAARLPAGTAAPMGRSYGVTEIDKVNQKGQVVERDFIISGATRLNTAPASASPARMVTKKAPINPAVYESYETAPLLDHAKYASYFAEPFLKPVYSPLHLATRMTLTEHFTLMEKVAPYSCEFFGSLFLSFSVCVITLHSKQGWGATAIASVIMAVMYAMAPISGGHLNPVVSLACGLAKKMTWFRVFGYMFSQYWGGLLGGLLCHALFPDSTVTYGPYPGYSWTEVGICETIFTAMLVFVFLNCFYSERNNPGSDPNQFYALAVGFVMIAGGHACGDISGSLFNPVVTLGVQVVRADYIMAGAGKFFQYTMYQVIGACIGAFLFHHIRSEEHEVRGLTEAEREVHMAEYIPPQWARIFAELYGTFMIVLTFGLNILMGHPMTAWSTGAAVMAMTYSLSNVSGAHFNPAVTLSVILSGRRKLSIIDGLWYVLAQLFAGVMAGFVCILTDAPPANRMPNMSFNWDQISIAEIVFTFLLAYVMLACSTAEGTIADHGHTRQNFYYALAIGACYTAGGLATTAVTGGSINPAISLGIASATGAMPNRGITMAIGPNGVPQSYYFPTTPTLGHCAYYCVFELFGAVLAACMFQVTHAKEYRMQCEVDV